MRTKHAVLLAALALATFALAQDAAENPPDSKPAAESLPTLPAALSQEQIKALIHKVTENDMANDKRRRAYTYIQREEEHNLDGNGGVKSTESTTSEVMVLYGDSYERVIAKNDKPLSRKDAAKEDEKEQKFIEKHRNESDKERRKRQEREEKDREEGRKWESEISEAYDFRLVGMEALEGRDNYVIDAEPHPGFKPHLKYANYLSKFRFRLWVDKAEMQVAKLEAECLDTVSWGLFVARLHKGTHILLEQTRVNDEVWLPKREAFRLSARIALLKNFNVDTETTYRDYRKFRTEAKIVGVGEINESK